MMASVIKHINVLCPFIDVLVDEKNLPPLARGFFDCAEIKFQYTLQRPDHVITHVGYPDLRRCQKHLIGHMLEQVNEVCGTKMEFSFNHMARAKSSVCHGHNGKVTMVSCGRDVVLTRDLNATGYASKNWGVVNFLSLAERLHESGRSIVQVGHRRSPLIPGAEHRLGTSFEDLQRILRSAAVNVVQIDGLAHLCGHLEVPTIAIYCGQEAPPFTGYPSQSPLREPTPAQAAFAVESYCSRVLKEVQKTELSASDGY